MKKRILPILMAMVMILSIIPSNVFAAGDAPGTRQIISKEDIGGTCFLYHSVEDGHVLDLYCFNSDLSWPHTSDTFTSDYYVPDEMDHLSEDVQDKIYRIYYAGYPHNNIGLYAEEEEEEEHTLGELDLACDPPNEVKQLLPDINWAELDFNAASVVAGGTETQVMVEIAKQVFIGDTTYIDAAMEKPSFYYAAAAYMLFEPETVDDYLAAYAAICKDMAPAVYEPGAAHDATQYAIWRILYENRVPNNSNSLDEILKSNQLVKDLVDFANGKGEHADAYIPERGSTLTDLEKCKTSFESGASLLRSDGTSVGDGKITFYQKNNGSYVSESLRFFDEMHTIPYTIELVGSDGDIIASQTNYGSGWISFSVEEAPESAKIILKTDHAIPSDIYHYAKEGEESLPAESLTKNNYQHMGGCYFETLPMTLELSTEFLDLEKTQIHVNKVWEDNGNQDKIRPESIIVNLLADGNVVDNARLSEDNHWEHTFNDLDLYNTETKNKIEYSVEEISVEGYTTVMAGNANDGFTITNTHVSPPPAPETGNLTVSKTVSGDGASTEKAFTFTVRLNDTSINGTYGDMTFDKGVAIFTLKAKESKTSSGLPAGTGYSVTESDNEGYTVTVNGTTDKEAAGTITANDTAFAGFNNYKSGGGSDPDPEEPAPAKVMLSAQKTLDGSLPVGSDYSFVLKDENGRVIQTVQNHGGSITFNTLTFSKTGTFIYTISEVSGSNSAICYDATVYKVIIKVTKAGDYKAVVSYEKDGTIYNGVPLFANITKPSGDDTISVSVNKLWEDNHNVGRPTSVTVQLYKNGIAYGSVVELSAANGWQCVWQGLDQSAVWTVDEVNVPSGYSKTVSNSGNAWTITNTLQSTPDAPTNPDTPITPDKPDKPTDPVPKTDDPSNMGLWLILAIGSAFSLAVFALSEKSRKVLYRGKHLKS